jgi:hypothetical protein
MKSHERHGVHVDQCTGGGHGHGRRTSFLGELFD